MIRVEHLIFDYPGHRALDDVSFEIAPGTITALVGPNGAGKSTLMRVCSGLERPFAGRVRLQDIDVHESPREAHQRMGYLPDFFGLYDDMTVRQCLEYRAAAQGVSKQNQCDAVDRAAARMQLTDRLDQRAGELSRGLRQRLAIGATADLAACPGKFGPQRDHDQRAPVRVDQRPALRRLQEAVDRGQRTESFHQQARHQ